MRFATVLIGLLALGMPGYALAHGHDSGDDHDHGGCSCCRHEGEHHKSAKTDAAKASTAKPEADQKNAKATPEKAAAPAAK